MLRVVSIPTLILLDGATGTVITRNAQTHVTKDPEGIDFPWKPKSLDTVLFKRGPFVDSTGQIRDPTEIEGQIKCLYFSANWVSSTAVDSATDHHFILPHFHAINHELFFFGCIPPSALPARLSPLNWSTLIPD